MFNFCLHKIEGKDLNCSYLGSQKHDNVPLKVLSMTAQSTPATVNHADERTMVSLTSQPVSNF